ncbi:hypothetical protein OK016_26635 [Vibrio chagasii]|nr:hypothetical protein [Vibrio chagasii]
MRFNAPDSLAPFNEGWVFIMLGVYCHNDPINFTGPGWPPEHQQDLVLKVLFWCACRRRYSYWPPTGGSRCLVLAAGTIGGIGAGNEFQRVHYKLRLV